ncbi:MAG: SGNH/GDSL hydrolase family protein [Verrucomicrobiales bacterium]
MKFYRLKLKCLFALSVAMTILTIGQEAKPPSLPEINKALSSGGSPVKIICFGDSVTGVYYHTGGVRAYTNMLGIALKQIHPKADVTMINAGISGHTTVNALARIDRDVIAHQPDVVTVMFGLNDVGKNVSIEDYRKNLIEIVKRCRAAGSKVVLCTPNAVVTTKARPIEKLTKYCNVIREVAKEHGVPLCDSFAEFEAMGKRDREAWLMTLSGEIHPNMAGHKAIAEQLARTITGQTTSLVDVGPPRPALAKTVELLKKKAPVKILAMPPYDKLVNEALKSIDPAAKLETTPWIVEDMTRALILKDASHRVRKMKPNLVFVAIPRGANSESREAFIYEQMWTVNYAQSFGKKEWDVVVIHPSVAEPKADPSDAENDALIRTITAAQDLHLIDRAPGDERSTAAILSDWISKAVTASAVLR